MRRVAIEARQTACAKRKLKDWEHIYVIKNYAFVLFDVQRREQNKFMSGSI